MKQLAFVATFAFALAACPKPSTSKPPTASNAKSATKAGAQALKGKKPADAMMTKQAPKSAPAERSAGSTKVTPKDVTKGGSVEVATWAFSDVDLDGDGTNETGVVAMSATDLAAWWTGSFLLEDGNEVPYDAMLWTEGDGVGFIIEFGQAAVACGVDSAGAAACMTCDNSGACTVSTN